VAIVSGIAVAALVAIVGLVLTGDLWNGNSKVGRGSITTERPPPPPSDRDNDGVPDTSDACPDEPASTDDGCPVKEPDPEPDPQPQVTYLTDLFSSGKTDGGTNVSYGNADVGVSYIGGKNFSHSIRYRVYAGDPEREGELTASLGGKYAQMKGSFGIDRSKNECPEARVGVRVEDDAGQIIWPRGGGDASATVERGVSFKGVDVRGAGGVKLVPVAQVEDGVCLNNEMIVAFGDVRFVGASSG
jgi:hypothetical protein